MLPSGSVDTATRTTTTTPSVENSPAQAQADTLVQRATTPWGVDTAQLRSGVQEQARLDPQNADEVRQRVEAQLSPRDLGDFLSGFFDKVQDIVKGLIDRLPEPPKPSTASDLSVPATAADAPPTVRFSSDTQAQFQSQWDASFPGGSAMEQGGTLVFDRKTGEMRMINIGGDGATSGSFTPNTTIADPAKTGLLGVFHTHPYDSGSTGISFSGADAGYMINSGHNVILAQSGDRQFMYVRTEQTPANVDYTQVNNDQNARIQELVDGGQSFEAAASQAASELATELNLAYYEGSNGVLNRVNP